MPQSGHVGQLLRVCRLLYREGVALLYGCNVFDIGGLFQWYSRSRFESWLDRIGEANRELIQHFHLSPPELVRGFLWSGLSWLLLSKDWEMNFLVPVTLEKHMHRFPGLKTICFTAGAAFDKTSAFCPVPQPVKQIIRTDDDPVLRGGDDRQTSNEVPPNTLTRARWEGMPDIGTTTLLVVLVIDLLRDGDRIPLVYYRRNGYVSCEFVITKQAYPAKFRDQWAQVDTDRLREDIRKK